MGNPCTRVGVKETNASHGEEGMRIVLLTFPVTLGCPQSSWWYQGFESPHRRFSLASLTLSGTVPSILPSLPLRRLHLPARPSLHAHYRRFLATVGALTPAPTLAALRLAQSMNTAPVPSRRSPRFTCTAFQPFRLHPPDSPLRRFLTLPLSSQGFRRIGGGLDFTFASQARRSARPYRVRHPTDWSFTSRCFGPHFAVTPFRLVSGRRAHA
jgi:hypothetical protein